MADFGGFFGENWSLLQQANLFRPSSNLTFENPVFETAPFRVLIVMLSPFRDVSRSTPHLFLFQAVRAAVPEAFVDMAFFPPEHDRKRLLGQGIPLLVGIRSWRDMRDFDVVLISNAYTLELINLPYLLLNSGVPTLASKRNPTWPPLILGGSNAMAVQTLITSDGDGVVDALFFGEGERQVSALVRALHGSSGQSKVERLLKASEAVDGLWVANGGVEQVVTKAVCHLPTVDDLTVDYPSLNSDEADTARLQINFGCPSFCSFCFEGYDRKPYRELPLDDVMAAARMLKAKQGVEALDVYSFNFNTHERILELLLELNKLFERVNVKSQRVDLLAVMPSLLEAEVLADKRSFTLGIEGISNRLRTFLHKSLSDAEIEHVLVRLLGEKIREIKLFYILTGHETEEDLAEFHDFVLRLKAWRRRQRSGIRVVFSFGLLVRMPFTPLRYDRLFLDEDEWRPITGAVKSSCETNGFEFRLATPWEEYVTSQVLALGPSLLLEPILALAEQGQHYDLNLTDGYWEALRFWIERHREGWLSSFVAEKGPDYPFALDFVRQGVSREVLYRQFQQAQAGVDEGYCLGEVGGVPAGAGEPGRCLRCGACTTPEERTAILHHRMRHPGSGYLKQLETTMRTKWREQPVYARFWLPPVVAHAEPAWINALVMRSLLAAYPALVPNLLSTQESLFTTKANVSRYAGLYGETVVALKAWDLPALGRTLQSGQTFPGAVRFQGFLDAFEPGVFDRARLHLSLDASHFPNAGRQLRAYLQEQYVPVNLRGVDGGYVFDIPAKARKKRVIFEGGFRETEDRFELDLVVSPKFDLVDYLTSFTEPGRYREAQVEVLALELSR
ncbi:MAG: B12-binding domain-containing radical SAM protein [Anaerolineae bacterium]